MDIARVYKAVRTRLSPQDREFRRIWPSVEGIEGFLVSPVQERWLFGAAKDLQDGATIVEIGSFKGRSTTCLAYGARNSAKHVFAIDTFQGNQKDFKQGESYGGRTFFSHGYYDEFLQNIDKNGLSRYVTPLRGVSADIGKTWNRAIHFLFIDGGHEYEDVLTDFETFFPHVVPGGLVAFHDVHDYQTNFGAVGFPGVLKVWEEVAVPVCRDHGRCATLAFGRKQ
jgi:hypothetical protein